MSDFEEVAGMVGVMLMIGGVTVLTLRTAIWIVRNLGWFGGGAAVTLIGLAFFALAIIFEDK